jgi:hypothetical protein
MVLEQLAGLGGSRAGSEGLEMLVGDPQDLLGVGAP